MSLAYGTPVATPGGEKPIENLTRGDPVLTSHADGGWGPLKVAFSMGASPGGEHQMVFLQWQGGELIVSPDHPLQLANGAIGRADRLVPGQKLRGADGSPVTVEIVLVGRFSGGIHDIATDAPWRPGSLDGRLLRTGGVVSGDYTLQVNTRWELQATEPEA